MNLRSGLAVCLQSNNVVIAIFLQDLSCFVKIEPRRARTILVNQGVLFDNQDPVGATAVSFACFVCHRVYVEGNA